MIGLVTVLVRDIGSVPGVVNEYDIAAAGASDELGDLGLDRLLRGGEIDQRDDVRRPEAVPPRQQFLHVLDVVNAAAEVRPRYPITIHADQNGFLGHIDLRLGVHDSSMLTLRRDNSAIRCHWDHRIRSPGAPARVKRVSGQRAAFFPAM